jgi:hypothetical protein
MPKRNNDLILRKGVRAHRSLRLIPTIGAKLTTKPMTVGRNCKPPGNLQIMKG